MGQFMRWRRKLKTVKWRFIAQFKEGPRAAMGRRSCDVAVTDYSCGLKWLALSVVPFAGL